MRRIRNGTAVWGGLLLAAITPGAVAFALMGQKMGVFLLLLLVGMWTGLTVVHFATKPRRTRKPVALLLLVGILGSFLVPMIGLALGDDWLFFSPSVLAPSYAGFSFGLVFGVVQVAFGRLLGRGAWSGD